MQKMITFSQMSRQHTKTFSHIVYMLWACRYIIISLWVTQTSEAHASRWYFYIQSPWIKLTVVDVILLSINDYIHQTFLYLTYAIERRKNGHRLISRIRFAPLHESTLQGLLSGSFGYLEYSFLPHTTSSPDTIRNYIISLLF